MWNWIKWSATAVLILGSAVNGMGLYPWGPLMLIGGGVLWLFVAVHMKDRPLIVTNAVMIVAGGLPLLWRLFFL